MGTRGRHPPRATTPAVLALLACCLLGSPGLAAQRDGWEIVRSPAPEFTLQDLTGRTLRSSELAGKVVVIDFWATWCAPCIRELPDLAAYHKRLERQSEVALLSFDVTDDRDILELFVRENRISFPVYPADTLIGPYQLVAFPTKLVIDMREAKRDAPGVVRFRREGYTPVASIEARVAEILAEKPDAAGDPEER